MEFSTRAIHVGNSKDKETGAIVAPVHFSSTYVQNGVDHEGRFDYGRSGNPTRSRLQETIAALEGGQHALCFATGMAAIHGVTMLLATGDHILAAGDIYGGTYRLFHKVIGQSGIEVSLCSPRCPDTFAAAIKPNTKLVWLETIGNPLMSVADIRAIAELCRQRGVLLAVDNTFATPYLVKPLELGADIVMHSATKFFGGHSDLLGGALVVNDSELHDRLYYLQNATGAVMSSMDAFLCQRGIKTLALRVKSQGQSAAKIAHYLDHHPMVERVFYPGLSHNEDYDLANSQFQGKFGCLLSFELKDGYDAAKDFVQATKLFQLAVSLGAVESIIEQPASMSHASYDREDRLKFGITDGLIRISIGLEDVRDLISDLELGFDAASRKPVSFPSRHQAPAPAPLVAAQR